MSPHESEIRLPEAEGTTLLLHRLLRDAVQAFPEALAPAALPEEVARFRKEFPDAVVRFEAARLASGRRIEIARHLVVASREAFRLDVAGEALPLAEALRRPAEPDRVDTVPLSGSAGLVPQVPWDGEWVRGREVARLAERLHEAGHLSAAARGALEWITREGVDASGEIDLAGRRCAVLGAGAELAPTPLLLAAGADVLWIDVAAPPEALAKDSELSGRLHVPATAGDLLRQPREIAATLEAFAGDGALDCGLYAYAGGRGREWRLEAAMNAIARSLAPERLRSISLLVSPTSPTVVTPEEREATARRHATRPAWQAALERLGLLGDGPTLRCGDVEVHRAVLSVQGASYQAAQYLEKMLAAEVFAVGEADRPPTTVSANVAAITRTRSLSHPVFEAAFLGAPSFDVHTFPPETTRWLNGLLLLHDLLNPQGAARADGPHPPEARAAHVAAGPRVHGGLYALPYTLEPGIRAAAMMGLARRPRLALGLLPGRG